MKTVMCTKLLQYYNSQTLDTLNNAALLDPRFKSLSFLEEVEKVSTRLNVQEKFATYFWSLTLLLIILLVLSALK